MKKYKKALVCISTALLLISGMGNVVFAEEGNDDLSFVGEGTQDILIDEAEDHNDASEEAFDDAGEAVFSAPAVGNVSDPEEVEYVDVITHETDKKLKETDYVNIEKYVTVYNGTDYSAVYDFNYYINHNNDVKTVIGANTKKVLEHFVKNGMKELRCGKKSFDIYSYIYANSDLRRSFGTDYEKYFIHYIQHGKAEKRKAVGVRSMQNYLTVYKDVDVSSIYDFNYYLSNNSTLRKKYMLDDAGLLEYFAMTGIFSNDKAKASYKDSDYKTIKASLNEIKNNPVGTEIVRYALQFVGNPYVYGGNSLTNGTDCSGFTYLVFQHFGISIPRDSVTQGHSGKLITSVANAIPGDIFYYSWGHVALYIGNGKIVHASNVNTGIIVSEMGEYWGHPASIRRYF